MGNRLKEIRVMRGLGVSEAARKAGAHRDQIHRLERGERRLTDAWAKRLARIYDVAPRDLLSEEGLSVVVKYLCYRHGGGGDARLRSREPATGERFLQAPHFVMDPHDTFGFEILDRHAEGLNLGIGSRGLGRPLEKLGRKLRRGDKVVVQHFKGTRAEGEVYETLVGVLDRAVNGDLIVLIVSDLREAGAPVIIRRARRGEAPARGDDIDYTPRDDDFAEVIGVPVAAQVPL